jgi:NDP-sugar pyrophosphorylase family protein
MKVLCLAAGFGTRLGALTRECPKPLLEVAGRPVLSRIGDGLSRIAGLTEMVLLTNARFRGQFELWRAREDLNLPVRIVANDVSEPGQLRGANRDLALLWERACEGDTPEESALVIAGDNLHVADLSPHLADFESSREPTILCRELAPPLPPGRYGEVVVDADLHVTALREKPPDPRSRLASTCTYLFPADVRPDLDRYLEQGGLPDGNGNFIAWLAGRRRVRAAVLQGEFFDIGDLASLERARRHYAE